MTSCFSSLWFTSEIENDTSIKLNRTTSHYLWCGPHVQSNSCELWVSETPNDTMNHKISCIVLLLLMFNCCYNPTISDCCAMLRGTNTTVIDYYWLDMCVVFVWPDCAASILFYALFVGHSSILMKLKLNWIFTTHKCNKTYKKYSTMAINWHPLVRTIYVCVLNVLIHSHHICSISWT